ncbi:ThuA domain-containing protein [Spirosoma utsteinense]|uniref:Type 1 glutamine amidotransferase n=1 Tax=Spirosoma utsteinense TaxID=2585773 RepID=A0ABR6WD62_9BACT|nr:ThuA domain-containing protein [Spirosoma utsteinense]MBC3788494.1 type 1 glutamine amidotransferase [Spirosoma utsteinense]MBC3794462.1 type 1 glutamine amidotransferase [Spirosoma utsteinense]
MTSLSFIPLARTISHATRLVNTFFILMGFAGWLTSCQTSSTGLTKTTGTTGQPIRVLIVGGGTSHNFDMWYKTVDVQTLSRNGFATVNYIGDPDSILTYLNQADVLYLSNNRAITNPAVRQAIMAHVDAGKGLLIAHAALWYNWKDWPEYNQTIVSGGSRGHDKYGAFEVTVTQPQHPVMKGVEPKFTLKDERYYYKADSTGPGISVLASSSLSAGAVAGSDNVFPSVFVVKHPKCRIVGLALGHDAESHNIANYQVMLRNSVQWVARK